MTFAPSSLVMPALVTPPVLYAAAMAQRHVGQAAAGLVATLPFQLAIGSVAVGLAMGDQTAAELGLQRLARRQHGQATVRIQGSLSSTISDSRASCGTTLAPICSRQ